MKNILLLFIVACTIILNACSPSDSTSSSKTKIIAYYYGDSSEFKNFETDQLSHIIFSFLHLNENKLTFDNEQDSLTVQALVKLKEKNPSLKILLSLGGWGGCETCSDIFATEEGRQSFSESVKERIINTNTDGIDLDWEYPAIEGFPGHRYVDADKQNFTLLIESLRKTLGDKYEISFAAGGYTEYLEKSVEWKKVMPLVDRVNLMSYDLTNGYSVTSGHHTPLYSTTQQKESTDHAVRFLDSVGVPMDKIIIGAAFYARIFKVTDSLNNGLNRPCTFKTSVNFKDFKDSLQGFSYHWDSIAQAPYAYNSVKKEFATFDNKESIVAKVNYIHKKKLGGIMFWQLTGDKTSDGLLHTIYKTNPVE
jgi:chitinase